ncbi:aminodeoxychorismate synthase component I [Urechidicola vernalis]|uniref:Aminodeoxychorismate synthase component I n=1 Tax=Urechidicola vernalis TaxID=3075600 RepID=A0ABU2Y5W5_9FLAO|nr:aminodeoxychorismate synthase component I [Urechidicola sp. P050]MDT0553597.1 aminodeoxychorismate synthase component I [Urechidicola sp. P050]
MRVLKSIKIKNIATFKSNLLNWAQQFEHVVWLDSNKNEPETCISKYDAILAVDSESILKLDYENAFQKLKEYHTKTNDYLFGYLGYDLKNDVEQLSSSNYDELNFDDLCFFQPKKIFFLKNNEVEVKYLSKYTSEIETDLKTILNSPIFSEENKSLEDNIKIKLRIHKDEYFNKVNAILNHIHRGDIYEVSFCQEFYAENSEINPLKVYHNLNEISTPPFATFLKLNSKYLLSASPERFLKRTNNTIISQPIKGTTKRGESEKEDEQLKWSLETDLKERAENIMIVDLVRNDLSRTANKGTVKVAELCKVYSFKQVHQLISTVVAEVESDKNSIDIIKSMFPMGSMTGAPKIAAMKIIEKLEETKRGLYSGAVGYFTPNGDFDFNVVIRSILYNANNNYISYSVGGAITSKSIPENEYEECLLKAKAMREVLLNTN